MMPGPNCETYKSSVMRKYLFRGVVAAVAMVAVTIAVSCADDGNDGASGGNGNWGTVKYELSDVVKVFGFDGQNRYAYCPSVMATDDMTHMWFCGNPDENVFVDNIYHVTSLRTVPCQPRSVYCSRAGRANGTASMCATRRS